MLKICAWLPVVVTLGLTGCNSPADLETEQQKLLETDLAFAEASFADGAPEAFRRYLASDAVELPDGNLPLFGRDAIYEAMINSPEFDLTWAPEEAVVAKSGDLGYTWGTFWYSWADEDGNPVAAEGKYLNIWRKAPDGTWQVVVDISNENP